MIILVKETRVSRARTPHALHDIIGVFGLYQTLGSKDSSLFTISDILTAMATQ